MREHYDSAGRPRFAHPQPPMLENPRPGARDKTRATRLYRAYMDRPATGPGRVFKVPKSPATGVVIGELVQVGYKSERDGLLYRHTFRKRSRPLIIASSDGKQALIVGGRFVINGRGIVDK